MSVEAPLNYIRKDAPKAVLYEFQRTSSTLQFDVTPVTIADGRASPEPLTITRNGFCLVKHRTSVTDFSDESEVRERYFDEVSDLIKDLTGATDVVVMGGVLRSDDPSRNAREPARSVHVDFDEKTVRALVTGIVGPDAAASLLRRRFALINLWRGVRTVERTPLAVCDGSTIAPDDMVLGAIGTRPDDPGAPVLEGYNIAYSPQHRWYYFPLMQPDEVLVFKLCDTDPSAVSLAAHTAFDDPSSPADAAPRESYEMRTIAFF